jgi:glutathione synthase/RimK-type ligase-like ATP-grasp enzyme
MRTLVVVEEPHRWPLDRSLVQVVEARAYLTEPRYQEGRRVTVYNLCHSFAYQSLGYYVSLLAAARGHRPVPSVETLSDLGLPMVLRLVSAQVDAELGPALAGIPGDQAVLRIYFGKHRDSACQALAQALFHHFPVPLMQVRFARGDSAGSGQEQSGWTLVSLRPMAAGEVPSEETDFVLREMERFFRRPARPRLRKQEAVYSIAILANPAEGEPPSDSLALQRFQKAARELGMEAVVIGPSDYPHLAEFDGLFVRETTCVNHHTYRFARRAEAEGLVVIDDPESILRCCNKAFQAELFERHGVPCPATMLVGRGTPLERIAELGFPCVVKVPDSSFCRGVSKADDAAQLQQALDRIFESSELAVVQAFTPSGYDWRIGVLDRTPLYACRYTMAHGHWQIYRELPNGERSSGKVEAVPLESVPSPVLQAALAAANLIGDGLYGIDVKEVEGEALVIEVNDNPSLESDEEDRYLQDELYLSIMRAFWTRLERKRRELTL